MIVKDEAATLDRCLASAAPFVDEIILVDTGSTDRSPDIAAAYGAKVIHHPWTNDFAEARNVGLEQASGDWILWMDADEELEREDGQILLENLAGSEDPLLLVELINYYGVSPPDLLRSYRIAHHRLFRNQLGFRFMHPIHEQLNAEEVLGTVGPMQTLPVRIYHYGYLDDFRSAKGKSGRNIGMLLEQRERRDYSPWIDYHLASEWHGLKRYSAAIEDVNRAITRFLEAGQLPPSIVYKLKYAVMLEAGHAQRIWPAVDRAIRLYPDYVDLYFYKGISLLLAGEHAAAEESFSRCLAMGEHCTLHLSMHGVGSFLAHYYRGQCRRQAGAYIDAMNDYEAALLLHPGFEEAEQACHALSKEMERGCI